MLMNIYLWVSIEPLRDGNMAVGGVFPVSRRVSIEPLRDGNLQIFRTYECLRSVSIEPLRDGNLFFNDCFKRTILPFKPNL